MAETGKRKAPSSPEGSGVSQDPAKKPRIASNKMVLHSKEKKNAGALVIAGPKRTSGLQAPTMLLSGHGGSVYSTKFNATGQYLASASFDKALFLWHVYGECENFMALHGHKSAVLDCCWSFDSLQLYSASADNFGAVWDVEAGERIKQLRGHTATVNSVDATRKGEPFVITGSDDATVRLWDVRIRGEQAKLLHEYQILSAVLSDDSTQVFAGGIDNEIHCWDLRKLQVLYTLVGHNNTVTGVSLSPDGNHLLSNSMDNTLRQWDVRPFVADEQRRLVKVMQGHYHDVQQNMLRCSWSPDGTKVSAGSADKFVHVWDLPTSRILYKLPGHAGSVNEVAFHPHEPIIASGSHDRTIYLGEIDI